jgi:hypothetical protein
MLDNPSAHLDKLVQAKERDAGLDPTQNPGCPTLSPDYPQDVNRKASPGAQGFG